MISRSLFLRVNLLLFGPLSALTFVAALVPRRFKTGRPASAVAGDEYAEQRGLPPPLVQFMAVCLYPFPAWPVDVYSLLDLGRNTLVLVGILPPDRVYAHLVRDLLGALALLC